MEGNLVSSLLGSPYHFSSVDIHQTKSHALSNLGHPYYWVDGTEYSYENWTPGENLFALICRPFRINQKFSLGMNTFQMIVWKITLQKISL